jgi:hypothetical protein
MQVKLKRARLVNSYFPFGQFAERLLTIRRELSSVGHKHGLEHRLLHGFDPLAEKDSSSSVSSINIFST